MTQPSTLRTETRRQIHLVPMRAILQNTLEKGVFVFSCLETQAHWVANVKADSVRCIEHAGQSIRALLPGEAAKLDLVTDKELIVRTNTSRHEPARYRIRQADGHWFDLIPHDDCLPNNQLA